MKFLFTLCLLMLLNDHAHMQMSSVLEGLIHASAVNFGQVNDSISTLMKQLLTQGNECRQKMDSKAMYHQLFV